MSWCYEQLRAAVLAGDGQGHRFGIGVLTSRGMAAWMSACQQITPPRHMPARPARTGLGTAASEMVRVLAAMALAHV